METKYWTFNQNNSGGYFVEDDKAGVCECVIVEARSADEAKARLATIGSTVKGFDSFCGCCGSRWSTWIDDDDADAVPSIYGEPVETGFASSFRRRAFVHYLDGTFKEFVRKEVK